MDFESVFKKHLQKLFSKALLPSQKLLKKSLFYSLFGKASRFRPHLCFASAHVFGKKPQDIFPWAMAVEMIHCASLIHDDLPLMDDSKTRRGKKCNHLVFGEDIALLAGTCLFVQSFSFLKDPLFDEKRAQVLDLFLSEVGFSGLMSGQALDLRENFTTKSQFLKMIQLKTSSLISASVLGPFLLWGKNHKEKKALQNYSQNMGIAYQIADDLQDKLSFFNSKQEGLKELKSAIQKSLTAIKPFKKRAEKLKWLSLFLQNRALKFSKFSLR